MFKTLKIILLSIILVLSFYSLSTAVEKSNIDSIISYAESITEGKYDNFEVYKVINNLPNGTKIETISLRSKENTTDHDYFDWTWTIHVLRIKHHLTYDVTKLEILAKDYEDFVSPNSRGFTEWVLSDDNLDGKVDFAYRDHSIVVCYDEDCVSNYILFPSYPKGFINMDWYTPSEEEREERYNKEIDYWMKTIWGAKE